jgi:hypothetical protein
MDEKYLEMLEKMDGKVDSIKECQIRIENDLKYHIKRTDILEETVKPMHRVYDACKLILPFLGAVYAFKSQILKLLGE